MYSTIPMIEEKPLQDAELLIETTPDGESVSRKTILPAGAVDQVPSPLQKVLDEADVPELRLAIGRLPVTPVVRGRPVPFVSTTDEGVPNAEGEERVTVL